MRSGLRVRLPTDAMNALIPSFEHQHVLLNHFPIVGLAMGLMALALAFILRSRPAQIVALAVITVAAASALPVVITGQKSYKTIRGIADDAGQDWLDEHMERAERLAPAFYALAILGTAALAAPRRWPRTALPLTAASFALALVCFALSGWIADAGGQIRHPEFRDATKKTNDATRPSS